MSIRDQRQGVSIVGVCSLVLSKLGGGTMKCPRCMGEVITLVSFYINHKKVVVCRSCADTLGKKKKKSAGWLNRAYS